MAGDYEIEKVGGESDVQKMDNPYDDRVKMTINGQEKILKPSVAQAVGTLRQRMPSLRSNGIFKHPPDWTQEEIDFIADSLKMNVPIHTIAAMVHCEKHCLGRMIRDNPELNRLKEDQKENILDEAEYQIDRLSRQGNASAVMFILERLGRKRGWGQQEYVAEEEGERSGRIVMGMIPSDEVEKAETERAEVTKADKANVASESGGGSKNILTDPVQLQAVRDIAAEEAAKAKPPVIEVVAQVSPPHGYADENVGGGFDSGSIGYNGMGMDMGTDDPFSDGANSMFFQ